MGLTDMGWACILPNRIANYLEASCKTLILACIISPARLLEQEFSDRVVDQLLCKGPPPATTGDERTSAEVA